MSTKLVHVIKPSGTRFEFVYPVITSAEQILAELEKIKKRFGYNGTIKKADPNIARVTNSFIDQVDWADENSGLVFDHPDTIVAVGRDENGQFVETERLKGPPKPNPT